MAATETEGMERNARGELVLDLDTLRPKPRWLRLPGPNGEKVEVKIPGNLSLDSMLELRAIEGGIRDTESTEDEVVDEIKRFTDLLQKIIDDENPGNEIRLELGVVEATRLLIFLAQPDDSLAEAFVRAITGDDEGGAEKPDGASADARRIARAAGIETEEGEADAPLRSPKRSSSRSSRSASSTAGRPNGGKTRAARGKRSGSTSRSRGAAPGNASAN